MTAKTNNTQPKYIILLFSYAQEALNYNANARAKIKDTHFCL